jgi:hypothetical protein
MSLFRIQYKVPHKDAWVELSVYPNQVLQSVKGLKSFYISFPYGNKSNQLTPIIKECSQLGTKEIIKWI